MKEYKDIITNLINDIETKELENIKKASLEMYKCMRSDGLVHVFATGHSHMFSEELFYRACGLVQINPILEPSLMQHEGAVKSTQLERLGGLAKEIYNAYDIKKNEVVIVVSNSGINSVPVEFAKIAKDNGNKVIVITSTASSKKLQPRNSLNLHLYDLGDIVIDNHSPYGDGAISKEYGRIGACSTILNSYIAQSIVLEIISLYEKDNLTPPIYLSANTPGGDKHNQELMAKYKARIKSLY